jgi:tetratricopeptide (TPR) repeat protein
MNVWAWVEEYARRAREAGDQQRFRMTTLHPIGYRFRETDPDRALAFFEEGRRMAAALEEPWWVLFFDHWRATARMHFQRDYREVLDLVVRTALEARKPLYEHHPLRLAVYDDLVAAYLGIDPLGHADAIQQALEHLEQTIEPGPDSSRYLLYARQRGFAIAAEDLDKATQVATRELAMADADSDRHRAHHFSVFVHNSLCEIAWKRRDWDELDRQARAGEELARRVGHQLELSEMLLYRGLVIWQRGDKEEARRQFRTALARFGRLRMPPHPSGFDALAGFYEWEGDPRTMLAVRDRELSMLANKGRTAYETKVRIKRCRLLALLGEREAMVQELAVARSVAARLKQPGPDRAELEQIAHAL